MSSADSIDPQRDMPGKAHIADETLIMNGQTNERLPPGFDEFYVSDRTKKEGKCSDNEAFRWVRSASIWEQHEKKDRVGEFQDTHNARIVYRADKKPKTHGDLVLMAYPMEMKEREEAAERQEAEKWLKEIEEGTHPEQFKRDRDTLMQMKERSLQLSREAGYTGPASPTSGMSLDEAYQRYTPEQTEAEETRARRGPRRYDGEEGQMARLDRMRASAEHSQVPRGSHFAMGDSGFGRNPNSALAQVQRRNK